MQENEFIFSTDDTIDQNWRQNVRLEDIWTQNSHKENATLGFYLICPEWTDQRLVKHDNRIRPLFQALIQPHLWNHRRSTKFDCGIIHLDTNELCNLCGDSDDGNQLSRTLPCPPEHLPVFLLAIHLPSMPDVHVKYLSGLSAGSINNMWRAGHANTVSNEAKKEVIDELLSFGLMARNPPPVPDQALRIFVAGDRMSVGKTSVCLGLLGNLVQAGYAPDTLAYIKPATQNEKPQLVQRYCEKMGIPCVSIGPVVYYRGFTRAFLAGETETSEELLAKVSAAVDELAVGKSVVVIDGVGFPAVGSICGTDNASVALASSYPDMTSSSNMESSFQRRPLGVLLVGGPGVGSAVDAFNLNAAYFERVGVPVLGAVFNKLSPDGFYSLENCKKEISIYFNQNDYQLQNGRRPFGFCPLYTKLVGDDALDHVLEYIRVFSEHFDMSGLIERARQVKDSTVLLPVAPSGPPPKRQKVIDRNSTRTREEIEIAAINAGAAPSA
ncbi:AAA domain containing protein [Nitzschia inconspicua]|uniref:AAA domain containing protein n=1 Tax=Nitzschia inconspicua TaxID=303405 RepID=A0A9K3KNV9_9STRA|nr:AAA domain containing protein [Nitzschia inconspicua]